MGIIPLSQSQNTNQASNYVKFRNLPKAIQRRLLERQLGQGNGLAFKTGSIFPSILIVSTAVVWTGIVLYLTDNYLWSNALIIVLTVVSLDTIYLLLDNLSKVLKYLTSRSKNYLLVTPHYVIEIKCNDVWSWSLDQLIAPDETHNYRNGRYVSTRVELALEGGVTKTFIIKSIVNADDAVERIFHYKKLFVEAKAKNDLIYLNEHDDFIELTKKSQESETAPNKNLGRLLRAVGSIILTAGLVFGAVSLNNYFDDKKSWGVAESNNHAAALRHYLQTHPRGRWSGDARQKLQGLYDIAGQKYLASLNKDYDQKAEEAILQVLSYAKQTQNYHVQVVFERHNEIPQNIVEELKKEFEVKSVLSLGDTFSDAKMGGRENGLFKVVAEAFQQVIPDDILEFSTGCSDECVIFTVNYKIGAKDSLYYDDRQEKLSDAERTFYPGIFINWDFNIKTPNQPQNYNFELASIPAQEIEYDTHSTDESSDKNDFSKVLDADKNYIYDSMVASAFDDFKTNLVHRMGIGAEPAKGNEDNSANVKTVPTRKKNRHK